MKKVFLICILVLAAFLRLYNLTALPDINADEAAIGYNAYSILQTGKDEHGNPFPIHFQSFGDYKPGLYFYIVVPFVSILGLNDLAVRLPGAILGIGTVFLVWLLARRLFPKIGWFPEVAALFLAISPWHIHFSRGGWEVNAAGFFIIFGVWSFIKGLEEKKWFYASIALFIASLYTYHAARIITPLLISVLFWVYREKLLWVKQKFVLQKKVLIWAAVGIFLTIPLLIDFVGPAGLSRASGVGLFADEGPFWKANEQRGEHDNIHGKLAVFLHNRPLNYGIAFFENYAKHFDGKFLFFLGDEIQRDKVPRFGQMYLIDLIFLLIGFIFITRNFSRWKIIIAWLIFAPIPAALTFQSPHALRAQSMVIPLVMISAYGAVILFSWLSNHIKPKLLLFSCYLVLITFLFWDFTRYLHEYHVYMAKTYNFSSQYGVKELVEYIKKDGEQFSQIIVTDRYDQPYILFLFYMKYPPDKFQGDHTLTPRDKFGFSTVRGFDKYKFLSVNWDEMRNLRDTILVGAPNEINDIDANITKRIYFPSGDVAFEIVPL